MIRPPPISHETPCATAVAEAAGEVVRRHSPSRAMTSPGTGSGVVGAWAGLADSGRSFRRRIIDRQISTCGQVAAITAPLRPESRPEAGRSSRTRPSASKAAAVLVPTPLTPGMLSEASPDSARKSGYCPGVMP